MDRTGCQSGLIKVRMYLHYHLIVLSFLHSIFNLIRIARSCHPFPAKFLSYSLSLFLYPSFLPSLPPSLQLSVFLCSFLSSLLFSSITLPLIILFLVLSLFLPLTLFIPSNLYIPLPAPL